MEEFDNEKFEFYLNGKFYFCDEILFSMVVKQPQAQEIILLKKYTQSNK